LYILDITNAVAIGVGVPCVTICVIAVGVLLYKCHKNRLRLDRFTAASIANVIGGVWSGVLGLRYGEAPLKLNS